VSMICVSFFWGRQRAEQTQQGRSSQRSPQMMKSGGKISRLSPNKHSVDRAAKIPKALMGISSEVAQARKAEVVVKQVMQMAWHSIRQIILSGR
jgi:hypothetical protein